MPRLVIACLAVVSLLVVSIASLQHVSSAADGDPKPAAKPRPRDDFNLNEFPSRPAPAWVKMIDQGTRNPDAKGIFTPDAINLELVAQEPLLINPVGMTFDDAGVPFVLEWKQGKGGGSHVAKKLKLKSGEEVTVNIMVKNSPDVLKSLSSSKGDGKFDGSKTLMDDLRIPSSVIVHDGWVYTSSLGQITRHKQSKADGPYDVHETVVQGLCGFHHHQASGMTITPDGWLLISSGDDDNNGEGSDGSRATVLRTGAVFMCRPDGSQLREFARGFRNPYRDVAMDPMFNIFHVDNDQEDGSKFQGVRLMNIQEGADFGWRLLPGAVCCRTDFARGAVYGEKPGKMPSMLKTGRGSPAGVLIYEGTAFPDQFRGLFIYADVYRKMVRAYRVVRDGSTFKVTEQFDLMKSDNPLFRPTQAVVGPDGAIYIVDWATDSGGAGRLFGDEKHGRIWRLTWKGTQDIPAIAAGPMDTWAKLLKSSDAELVKALESRDFQIRFRAMTELTKRGEKNRPALIATMLNKALPAETRAMAVGGACRLLNGEVLDAILKLLDDENFELRRVAVEAIGHNHLKEPTTDAHQMLAKRLSEVVLADKHPAVRRSAGLAMASFASSLEGGKIFGREHAIRALFQAIQADSNTEPYVNDGLLRAIETFGINGLNMLTRMLGSEKPETSELAVILIESLRTREGALYLDKLLKDELFGKLSPEVQSQIIAAYRYIQVSPNISTEGLANWLRSNLAAPINVQITALETLSLVGGASSPDTSALAIELLKLPQEEARIRVIRAIGGGKMIAAVKALAGVVANTERSNLERKEAIQALEKLRAESLPFLSKPLNPGVETVLDQLAAVVEDPKAGEIRGDALGLISQVDFNRAKPLAMKLLDSGDAFGASLAIRALGSKPEQATEIGKKFVDGKLPRELLPQVAEVLRRHADKDASGKIKELLTQVFRGGLLVSLEPNEVARVEKLVKMTGDPARGRAIYLDAKRSQCVTCHKLEGVGGQVGPDLTKVHETHTVAKILESIIDPSKEVKEGFSTWNVVTKDGKVYSGLKVIDTDKELVIRDATGKDIRVLPGEIEEKKASVKSMMPEGVAAQLNYQEFIDLVAFLKSKDAQAELKKMEKK